MAHEFDTAAFSWWCHSNDRYILL